MSNGMDHDYFSLFRSIFARINYCGTQWRMQLCGSDTRSVLTSVDSSRKATTHWRSCPMLSEASYLYKSGHDLKQCVEEFRQARAESMHTMYACPIRGSLCVEFCAVILPALPSSHTKNRKRRRSNVPMFCMTTPVTMCVGSENEVFVPVDSTNPFP